MAETDSPVTPPPTTDATPAKIEKVEKTTKVERPDEEKYKKELGEADKQLSALTEKLVLCGSQC